MKHKVKHPTLSEVAKIAGVGTTTVSRVINGGQSVDLQTLARVQRAIESLGYMPNQAARILKGDRTRTVGLIIPSIADSFFSNCAESAQAIARSHDSVLIVLTTQNEPKVELEAVHVLMRHRVDGFMIAPSNAGDDVLSRLLRRVPTPVVALDRPIAGSAIPSVLADNFAGAQLATRHLIEHGYKRIVCVTRETHLYTIGERIRGYREAMLAAGLKPVIDSSLADHGNPEKTLNRLLGTPSAPEALFTLKNSITIAIFDALQKQGVEIPATLALLGYDDFQLAGTVRPSISVIQQPIDEIGHVAAELLFKRMLNPPGPLSSDGSGPLQRVLLSTRLIRRASCGCSPAET